MHRKRSILTLLIALLMILAIGCAAVQSTKPYAVTKATAEETLFQARVLQNQGAITAEEFSTVKAAYDTLKKAQDAAIDARLAFLSKNSQEAEQKMNSAATEAAAALAGLISLAEKFKIGGKP